MPGGEHSLLQGSLGMVINGVIIPQKLGHAFIELHCTFGRSSLVPDISFVT